MRHTCRLFPILATCAVLISSATAFAQIANTHKAATTPSETARPTQPAPKTTPDTPKPTLIVWARTDIPNQGAPTLDLADLERYFVKELSDHRIENVIPSATAKIPSPPDPQTYLLELSVDALQTATRAMHVLPENEYKEDPVLSIELSLAVKNLTSGRIAGRIATRQEYHLTRDELDRLEPKRVALYKATDRLADRFIDAADEGKFGEQLKSIQIQLWAPLQPRQAMAALEGALCLLAIVWLIVIIKSVANRWQQKRRAEERQRQNQRNAENAQQLAIERQNDADDKRAHAAIALSLATDNFSDPACWDAAHDGLDKILARREAIEDAEAARRLNAKKHKDDYLRIAARAASTSDFSEAAIVEILRKADEWDYRMLREAEMQNERRQHEPAAATK